MKQLFAVGLGGFFGAMTRFEIGQIMPTLNGFPYVTIGINSIGCFLLAWLFTKYTKRTPIILAVGTGFLGAFTTFSTFSLETLLLVEQGKWLLAGGYVVGSIGGGLFCAMVGVSIARRNDG